MKMHTYLYKDEMSLSDWKEYCNIFKVSTSAKELYLEVIKETKGCKITSDNYFSLNNDCFLDNDIWISYCDSLCEPSYPLSISFELLKVEVIK